MQDALANPVPPPLEEDTAIKVRTRHKCYFFVHLMQCGVTKKYHCVPDTISSYIWICTQPCISSGPAW